MALFLHVATHFGLGFPIPLALLGLVDLEDRGDLGGQVSLSLQGSPLAHPFLEDPEDLQEKQKNTGIRDGPRKVAYSIACWQYTGMAGMRGTTGGLCLCPDGTGAQEKQT